MNTMTRTRPRGDAGRRMLSILVVMTFAFGAGTGLAPSSAADALQRELTLTGPLSLMPGETAVYQGQLTLADLGLPRQEIGVYLDGERAASLTTDLDGAYSFEHAFAEDGNFELIARAFEGTPIPVESPPLAVKARDVFVLSLSGPMQVDQGEDATFSGRLLMNGHGLADEQIRIMRLGLEVANVTTDQNGAFTVPVGFSETGIFQVTARAFADTPHRVTSPVVVVRVGDDLGPFASVAVGVNSCSLLFNGTVYCWGNNRYGPVGDGTNEWRDRPVMVHGLTNMTSVSTGDSHVCAVRDDGTLWCWGRNQDGQLGDGTDIHRNTPVQVVGPDGIGFLTDVVSVSAGIWRTCAVRSDGSAWCWGVNHRGQLGNGERSQSWEYGSFTPVQVVAPQEGGFLEGVTSISAGALGHTCATTVTGTAYCWGGNQAGQIGNGEQDNLATKVYPRPTPVLNINDFTQVAVGALHTCGVTVDGAAYCWGYQNNGRIGNGQNQGFALTPSRVLGLEDVTSIHSGAYTSTPCALLAGGAVYCWGTGTNGAIGDGMLEHRTVPVQVAIPFGATSISAGLVSACATDTNGNAWCWGQYSTGSLGRGTSPPSGYYSLEPWPDRVLEPVEG